MLAGGTTEQAAGLFSIAPETIRYRMRKITQSAGFDSRAEMLAFIKKNRFGSVFVNSL